MRFMKFALPVLAILIAFSGCPGTTIAPDAKNPVATIVIKNGASTVTEASTVAVQIGSPAKALDVSVTPAKAASVTGFTVDVSSGGRTEAGVNWDATTKKITVTPNKVTASDITVTVKAKNDDNGADWITTNFKVKVNSTDHVANPVSAVAVKDGETTLTPTSVITVMVNGQSKELGVSVTPAGAESEGGFTVVPTSGDTTKVSVSYSSLTNMITVSPVAAATGITVTVKAKNDDNEEDWETTSFLVDVEPASGIAPESIELTETGNSTPVNNTTINVDLELADEVQLSAKILPENAEGTVSWSSGDETVATVSGGLVTLLKAGTSVISASAGSVTATVTVEGTVDENLLFMWRHDRFGVPKKADGNAFVWNSNTNTTTSTGILRGVGKYYEAPIFIGTLPNNDAGGITYDSGFILDSIGANVQNTAGSRILVIGSNGPRTVQGGAVTIPPPPGIFDFMNIPAGKGIRVTVTGAVLTDAEKSDASPRVFRVSVNNCHNTESASPLNTIDVRQRLFYFQNPEQEARFNNAAYGSWDGENFTARVFRPEEFAEADNPETLEYAFLSLVLSGYPAGANKNGKVKITGLRIEYVPYTYSWVKITLDPEADFAGIPDDITLSKTGLPDAPQSMTIELENSADAHWLVDGVLVDSDSSSYLLDSAGLKTGKHSLTVLVTINEHLYSKSVAFTVVE